MRRDVHFLKSRGMLDYSLLIAIEESKEEFDVEKILEQRRRYTAVSKNPSIVSRSVRGRKGSKAKTSSTRDWMNKSELNLKPKVDERGFLAFSNE